MDKILINKFAENAVRQYIMDCKVLVPYIDDNDKTPMWDGDIYVYNSEEIKNKNFIGRYPLHIKGIKITEDFAETISYSVRINDLINCSNEGGCAFFVVQVRWDEKEETAMTQIFYDLLSKDDINSLLKDKSSTQTAIAIQLARIPKDKKEFLVDLVSYLFLKDQYNDDCIPIDLQKKEEKMRKLAVLNPEKYMPKLADTLIAIGKKYIQNKEFDSAERYLEEAQYSVRHLVELNPEKYMPKLADTLIAIGNIYIQNKEFDSAERYLEEALHIVRHLVELNPEKYMPKLADSLIAIGNTCIKNNEFNRAEKYFHEARYTIEDFAHKDPEKYMPILADTLIAIANTCIKNDELNRAEEYFHEAKYTIEDFAHKNPEKYMPILADTLIAIANTCIKNNEFNRAEKYFHEARYTIEDFAHKDPEKYMPILADTLIAIANVYIQKNNLYSAERYVREAIHTVEDFASLNSEKYMPILADTLIAIANTYIQKKELYLAERHFKEAINIVKEYAYKNPKKHMPKLAEALIAIANTYIQMNESDSADDHLQEAISIVKEYASMNSEKYMPKLVDTFISIANIYIIKNELYPAEKYLQEARNIVKDSAFKNQEKYMPKLAEVLVAIANTYILKNDLYSAEKHLQEAINIGHDYAYKGTRKYLHNVVLALIKLGDAYFNGQSLDSALNIYKDAFTVLLNHNIKDTNTNNELRHISNQIAYIYVNKKLYKEAEDIIKKTFQNRISDSTIYQALARIDPDHYLPLIAFEHNKQYNELLKNGDAEKAEKKKKYLKDLFRSFAPIYANRDKEFTFTVKLPYDEENDFNVRFNFGHTKKNSYLDRIIAIIGDNGTGKTTILAELAKAIAKTDVSCFTPNYPLFTKAITISYSAFDNLYKVEGNDFNYAYCGIKQHGALLSEEDINKRRDNNIKAIKDLSKEETEETNREQVLFDLLSLVLHEEILNEIFVDCEGKKNIKSNSIAESLNKMSSGETILTNIIIDLLANITNNSLILIDEPEIHLHPTAITEFVNIINDICIKYSSCCIMATHSPLVIQSVLSRNVIVMRREDNIPKIDEMRIESFGEDLSTISEEVFGNRGKEKLYEKLLKNITKENDNFDKIKGILQNEDLPLSLSSYLLIDKYLQKNEKL